VTATKPNRGRTAEEILAFAAELEEEMRTLLPNLAGARAREWRWRVISRLTSIAARAADREGGTMSEERLTVQELAEMARVLRDPLMASRELLKLRSDLAALVPLARFADHKTGCAVYRPYLP
jgi:hypothetical protein